MNHLFNIFSVRLQTLSKIIILSIPFNPFNHRCKISISGLNCSRYIICKYLEVLVTRKIVHTLNARRTQLTCVFRKKNKEMLIWKCFLFRLSARNNWIDRACSFPYYFLRTHCQNISVFNMIYKYTVSSFLYSGVQQDLSPIVTSNNHFSLG